jgi:hypothetical protein
MVATPRDFFLNNLSKWEFDVPLQTQWIVRITPRAYQDAFLSNIQATTTTDHYNFRLNPYIMSMLFGPAVQTPLDGIGLYYAQSITLPSEAMSINNLAVGDGNGGFLGGPLGGDRTGDRNINIDFLETNMDFADGIIRPWIITTAYKGLIELAPQTSIKADIEVVQYTKGEARPVRKVHSFLNCTPYSLQSKTLDYDAEKIVKNTVGWTYNHYYCKLLNLNEATVY